MQIKNFLILIVIYFLIVPQASCAFFEKKDYKKAFLEDALNAEKRHNDKSAFFLYEKGLFYYKNDKVMLEAYANFCERQKYYEKAITLNKKLYNLTKDEHYLFKSYALELKNGHVAKGRINQIISDNRLTPEHKKAFNNDLIKQFFYNKDWTSTKVYCDKSSKKDLNTEAAKACSIVNEKLADEKAAYGYYIRDYELNPKDVNTIKKILAMAEKRGDIEEQEKFLKRLAELNPKDKGIRYRLAGFYEKHKQYGKAIEVYKGLIASGDSSKHVKDSYAFALKKSKGEPEPSQASTASYAPRPLNAYEKKEMALYKALDNKDFKKAAIYLDDLLKKTPKNAKFLQLRLDVAMAQDDFKNALIYFENFHKNDTLSQEDAKLLAFLYSKNDNLAKALEIIEGLLQNDAENAKLLNLALDYSMAQKNWDKAIIYNGKLLSLNPSDEKLLKNQGNFYSIKKDFGNAIASYNKLIAVYPKLEYKLELVDLLMANKDFACAQALIEPLYMENSSNYKIIKSYLNVLVAQEKLEEALALVHKHCLRNTKEGAIIVGDFAMKNKDYRSARNYYCRAFKLDKKDAVVENKIAQSYRMLKESGNAVQVYQDILCKYPNNKEAKIGVGYLNIDNKEYEPARKIFNDVLAQAPDYKPAKIAIANSYVANGDDFQTLESLRQMSPANDVNLMKAQTYYKMGMLSDAKKVLSGIVTQDAEDLKYKIRRDEAIAITPNYTYFQQTLAQNFKLDYNKTGVNVTQGIKNNLHIFTDYNIYTYRSGYMFSTAYNDLTSYTNLTNEVRLGVTGRPTENNEIRADVGAKIFQYGQGAMLNTDTWIKHYFNDRFSMKLGFWRNNLEQSYLSAVGTYVGNVFTGQVADNRSYIEYEYRLPRQCYAFGRTSYGIMKGQNIPTNPYMEQMFGFGKLLHNDPDAKVINKVNLDFVSYNSGYRYNLLNIYDNAGNLYGGYFSPRYFSADTLNIKLEGIKKKWKYSVKAFGGGQTAIAPNKSTTTWGIAPTLSCDFNDNVSLNLSYAYYNYADMQRNIFMFNFVFRGFKKRAKR